MFPKKQCGQKETFCVLIYFSKLRNLTFFANKLSFYEVLYLVSKLPLLGSVPAICTRLKWACIDPDEFIVESDPKRVHKADSNESGSPVLM